MSEINRSSSVFICWRSSIISGCLLPGNIVTECNSTTYEVLQIWLYLLLLLSLVLVNVAILRYLGDTLN